MSLVDKSVSIFSRDIVFTVIRLFTGVVLARKLGPVGFGIWAILDLIINYSRVFGTPRFEIASVHFLGKKEYQRGEVIFVTNMIAIGMGLLLIGLFLPNIVLIKIIFFKDVFVESYLIGLTLCFIPILFLSRNYQYFLLLSLP